MENLNDVLARLKYDRGQWEAILSVPCWPDPIEVWLPAEESGPTSYQRSVLDQILNHPTDLKSRLTTRLYEYCREFVGETFEALDDECKFVPFTFPELAEPLRIWDLVDSPAIEIEEGRESEVAEFDLIFSCKWDIEHRIRARFTNFEVTDVGL